jgi:hypothetical protein
MNSVERILHYECFSGICGDMHLGAMIDLGVPDSYVKAELEKLGLEAWHISFAPDAKMGVHGTRADVEILPRPAMKMAGNGVLGLSPRGTAEHEHRSYGEIKKIIPRSALDGAVKDRSLRIFAVLAEAEAKVHKVPVDEVAFHEVGAVDSILDIVGAAVCLEYLKPDRITSSTVELGGGFVKCQHGLIPVPAPAVVEILKGLPVKSGAVHAETTTPTGAAILAANVDEFTDDIRFRITRTAYGVGHRDFEIPNLLRVYLGERETPSASVTTADAASHTASLPATEAAVLVECNVDDMSPEIHGYIIDRLLDSGAIDAWISPIVMKKSRAAVTISALCAPEAEAEVTEVLYRETTTFGVRRREVFKRPLERDLRTVPTSLGEVRVKTAFLRGLPLKSKLEYEDIRRIAAERGMAFREVESIVLKELEGR